MGEINLDMLPLEVVSQVFHHLPLQCVLYTIPKVCRQWRALLQQQFYWWDRLHCEGIQVSREHRLELRTYIHHTRIIQLLQTTCQKHANTLYPFHTAHNHGRWTVNEEQVTDAGIYLLFKTPHLITLDISTKSGHVNDLDILLVPLSQTYCKVHFINSFF